MGLLVGQGVLFLGLRCDARDSRFYSEGFKRNGFQLLGNDVVCSVLAAFRLVQSGCGHPALRGWGNVVDNTEVTGPMDLEELTSPSAPPFEGE